MLLHIVNVGLVKGWGVLCQTPGDAAWSPPADTTPNKRLHVPLIWVFKHLLTFGLISLLWQKGKWNVISSKALFLTCACDEDKAFIKDWEYGHGSIINFHQTNWSYSAWMQTSLEGLSGGSTLANHPSALFICNFALFVILNYIWDNSIVSLALK